MEKDEHLFIKNYHDKTENNIKIPTIKKKAK